MPMRSDPHSTPRSEFWAGFRATIPLVVGAIPFGIIFGALAVNSGLSPAGTMGMSLFVFAGSSQFIATGLLSSGTGTLIIVLTTFVVNLRHGLYATTLGASMGHLSHKWLLPLGFWLTDETFVVTAQHYNQPDPSPNRHWFFLGSAIFMYANWQACTFIGLVAGQAIPDPAQWGLDFAMSVTFIGMVVPMIVNRPMLLTVVTAGSLALLTYNLPNKLGLILAAIGGIIAGTLSERRQPDPVPQLYEP